MKGTRRRGLRGQALAEFALVIPVFLLMVFAVVDFGRGIYAYNAISNAAREGGRTAIVNQTVSAIRARAASQAVAVGIDPNVTDCDPADPAKSDCVFVTFENASLTGSCDPSTGQIGCIAVVTVKHNFTLITPVLGQILNEIPLASTTQMPIEARCIDGAVTCPVP